jgi:hypothetical protein
LYLLQYSEESDESTGICSCDSDDEPIEFFEDNPELPIYYRGKLAGVPVVKVAEILLSPRLVLSGKVAKDKPVAVSKNVAFVFDNRHFKNTKDILSDSLGVWECTGTKTFHCIFTEDQVKLTDATKYGECDSVFKIERRFYKNKAAEDVKRNFTLIRSKHLIMYFINFNQISTQLCYSKGNSTKF